MHPSYLSLSLSLSVALCSVLSLSLPEKGAGGLEPSDVSPIILERFGGSRVAFYLLPTPRSQTKFKQWTHMVGRQVSPASSREPHSSNIAFQIPCDQEKTRSSRKWWW